MATIRLASFVCAFWLCAPFAYSTDSAVEVTAVAEEWPGLTMSDGTGWYWQFISKIYEPHGYKVRPLVTSWSRAVSGVESGHYDILVAEWKEPSMPFVFPYFPIGGEQIWCAKLKSEPQGCVEIAKDATRIVSWVRSMDFGQQFTSPDTKPVLVQDTQAGVRLLARGRTDAFIGYRLTILDEIAEAGLSADDFTLVKIGEKFSYLAFPQSELGEKLAKIYDLEFRKLYLSGWLHENMIDNEMHRNALLSFGSPNGQEMGLK